MVIRELKTGDDLKPLVTLSKEFFSEYEGNHPYFFKIDKIAEEDIYSYFKRFLDNEERRAFIAVEDNSAIGYITVLVQEQAGYWKIKRIGHISGLMVGKAHRRKGAGRQLLQAAINYFRSKGLKQYTLFTSVNNSRGIEFYRQCGLTDLYTTMMGEVEL